MASRLEDPGDVDEIADQVGQHELDDLAIGKIAGAERFVHGDYMEVEEPYNQLVFLQGWENFPGEDRKDGHAEDRYDSAADAVFDELNDWMRFAARKLMKDGMIHNNSIVGEICML